jgi:hypothetical protein
MILIPDFPSINTYELFSFLDPRLSRLNKSKINAGT